MFKSDDIAKLLLRVTLGVLLLFHGVYKLIHGIGPIEAMLGGVGLPHFIAYGVYVGELIAPIFLILGLYARVAAMVVTVNMLMALYLAYGFTLSLAKYGGLMIESPLIFLIMSILIILFGSGKYSINNK